MSTGGLGAAVRSDMQLHAPFGWSAVHPTTIRQPGIVCFHTWHRYWCSLPKGMYMRVWLSGGSGR